MKKYLPFLAIISLFILVLAFGIIKVPVDKLGEGEVKEWELPDSPLKLKADKSKVLDSQDVDDIRCDKNDFTNCQNFGKVKKYLYVSDKKIQKEKLTYKGKVYNEVRRTKNAIIYKVDPPKDLLGAGEEREYFVGEFYAGDPFYEDVAIGDYYQTESSTTTIEAFNEQTATSTIGMILDWIGVKQAIGACGDDGGICYAGGGDGAVRFYNNVSGTSQTEWDTVQNATTGDYAFATDGSSDFMGYWYSGNHWIMRAFYPIDTSALPDDATISSTTLYARFDAVTNSDNDGNDFLTVVKTYQASNTTLATTDYNDCGSTADTSGDAGNTPIIEGSNRIDITGVSGTFAFALDSTGRGWINKTGYSNLGVRQGHDVLDLLQAPSTSNRLASYFSEFTGTANDPRITVAYSISASAEQPKQDDIFWFN